MRKKFTLEEYNKIVEFQKDQFPANVGSEPAGELSFEDLIDKFFDEIGQLYCEYDNHVIDGRNKFMALLNPASRDLVKDLYVEKEGVMSVIKPTLEKKTIQLSKKNFDFVEGIRSSTSPFLGILEHKSELSDLYLEERDIVYSGRDILKYIAGDNNIIVKPKEKPLVKKYILQKDGRAFFKWNNNECPIWDSNKDKAYKFDSFEEAQEYQTPDWTIEEVMIEKED